MEINEPSEYYVSHFIGLHGLGGPNGPIYWKMINDLKKIQSAISEWPLDEKSTKPEGDSSLSRSEVIEMLGKIVSGVVHWETMEKELEYGAAEEEWQDRKARLKKFDRNHELAGRGLFHAKAILATNQHALWAALTVLFVNLEKRALEWLEECVDPATPMPPTILKCFAQLGFPDEEAVRQAIKPKETPPPSWCLPWD
jgi:hypothetical protein